MASSSTALSIVPKPVTEIQIENKEEEIEERLPTQQGIRVIEYPYPSTVNVENFVTIKLTKVNYKSWVLQIFSLVDILELRGFLMNQPPSQDYLLWKRTYMLLRGWILASISEDVFTIVIDQDPFSTSRSIMVKIENTFVPDINKRVLSPKPVTTDIGKVTTWKSICKYIPLYEAAVAGDWEAAKTILDKDKDAATAIISRNNFTILHVAVVTGKAIHFVENLVQYLPTEALIVRERYCYTALDIAAFVGNTKAAKILMKKNPALLSITNDFGLLPHYSALQFQHRDTYLYLQGVSNDDHYAGESACKLLTQMILCEYFDLALDLVKRYPHAAELESLKYMSPLSRMAEMTSSFRSGMCFNFLESFIYSCVPVKFENYSDRKYGGDIDVENPANNPQTLLHDRARFLGDGCIISSLLKLNFLPSIKNIRQKKLVHHQGVQLVKCLCEGVKSSNYEGSFDSRTFEPVTKAARFGTLEVVKEIVRILPQTIWSGDESRHNIAEIAVLNRCEKVFNIIYQMTELRGLFKFHFDHGQNNMLHLAGLLAPRHKLNLVSGAALQMQRELQWFKEVEKLVPPPYRVKRNSAGETPAMIFTREHKELVIEGEKWMKETANSCTIETTLIITIVFAAAITVPGGSKEKTGLPVFHSKPAFLLFAVSDAISLFTSSTSLLMFLSILTARYAEQDFLHVLPKRLIFGLLTLFLSITTMIIAFSTSVYLMFGEKRGWVIIPLAALSCLPITSFVTLQFLLLIDVFSSTYGRGIFGKQIDRPFHLHIRRLLQDIVKCFA